MVLLLLILLLGIPSSQPIHIMPPPMMIPIPSQPPPQLQSQGHLPSIQMPHLGQGLQPPQGLPPNLLAPQGGQSMPVSTTISLPSGVSLSQVGLFSFIFYFLYDNEIILNCKEYECLLVDTIIFNLY